MKLSQKKTKTTEYQSTEYLKIELNKRLSALTEGLIVSSSQTERVNQIVQKFFSIVEVAKLATKGIS